MSTPLHLILLAGGQGTRVGGVPKQFRQTGHGLLFAVSLRAFLSPPQANPDQVETEKWTMASVTVTAPDAWHEVVQQELKAIAVPIQIASPGATRTASTWQAISILQKEIDPGADDLVAVHDAARPFATRELLAALTEAALENGVAVPGLKVPDTIVESVSGEISYLQRESLLAVQTPQVSRWSIFEAAHRAAHKAGSAFTDDGGLLAEHGHRVRVVPGESGNWKVTTAADWQKAENLLRR